MRLMAKRTMKWPVISGCAQLLEISPASPAKVTIWGRKSRLTIGEEVGLGRIQLAAGMKDSETGQELGEIISSGESRTDEESFINLSGKMNGKEEILRF